MVTLKRALKTASDTVEKVFQKGHQVASVTVRVYEDGASDQVHSNLLCTYMFQKVFDTFDI